MKKRLFGILLSFAMMLTMLPVLGLSQSAYATSESLVGTIIIPGSSHNTLDVGEAYFKLDPASSGSELLSGTYGFYGSPTYDDGKWAFPVGNPEYTQLYFKVAGPESSQPTGFYISGGDGSESSPYTLAAYYEYPLWVGGTQVTSANMSGTGWSYTPAEGTSPAKLTLNGYSYSGEGYNNDAIHAEENLIIETNGTNNVAITSTDRGARAIGVTGELTFKGSGTINATGGYRSIVANKVTIESGTVKTSDGKYGIYANNNEEGNITVNGGVVNAGGEFMGLQSTNDVIIKKGTVIATCSEGEAISATNNITIEGGNVEATGFISIKASKKVIIDSGSVKATGIIAGIVGFGGVTINNGTIEATTTADSDESFGIYGNEVTINDGQVIASGTAKGIQGLVKNAIAGTGWDNPGGTGTERAIEVNKDPGQTLDYKKVQFPVMFTVTFTDGQGKTLKTEKVASGKAATAPSDPTRDGYTFKGWDKDFSKVTEDMTVTALWEKKADPTPKPKSKAKPVALVKGIATGSNSLKFKWKKVKGAAKYEIWMSKCNTDTKTYYVKKVKAFGASKTSWTKKKLKSNTAYKFRVVAKDASGKVICKSLIGHALTGNVRGDFTNAKSLKVKKSSFTLKKGKTARIKATQTKVMKGKKLLDSGHSKLLRYKSNNTSVAKVSSSGKITAVGTGSCKVYVQTVNGIWKTVKVTVK